MTLEATVKRSFPATIQTETGDVTFRVMHPIEVLRSRAYNVAYLNGYQTKHARTQLAASIFCAREYVREAIARREFDVAKNANIEIFRIAAWRQGLEVYTRHQVDIFAAVVLDSLLHPNFVGKHYPKMCETIAVKRERAARARLTYAERGAAQSRER